MNDIAELTLKINAQEARLAQLELDKLNQRGKESANAAELVEAAWKKVATILGPTVLVASITHAVKSAIELQEKYATLAEVAGSTAEAMSAMDLAARRGNVGLEQVAQTVAFLSKSIGEAKFGDVAKQGIFKALGIDINDGRDASAVLYDVSKALLSVKDQNLATYASQLLLSRGFSQMRPFMRDLVELGGGVARVTNEQAARAKELQDKITELKYEFDLIWVEIANKLLPAMIDIVGAFADFTEEGREVDGIATQIKTGMQGVATVVLGVAEGFYTAGRLIGGLGAIAAAFVAKDTKLMAQLAAELDNDLATHAQRAAARFAQIWQAAQDAAKDANKPVSASGQGGTANVGRSSAEDALRQLAEDNRLYESRIAAVKGFAERYADAIKTANALAQEANKQGVLQDDELIKQLAANEAARLTVLRQSLQEQQRLAEQKGDVSKAAEAKEAIAQINAQLVANDAITTAQLTSLSYERARAYEQVVAAKLREGEDVADSLRTDFEVEQDSYKQRLEALEVYLSENREQIANAAELREQLEIDHQARLGDAAAQGMQQRRRLEQMTLTQQASFYFGTLQSITSEAAKHNKAMFELNKIAGIANTIISTQQGAAKALEWGWPLGPIFAGIIIAAGAANAAAIASTSFGSQSAPSVGAGGAAPVAPVEPVSNQPAGSQGQPITTIIKLEGESYSRKQVEQLFEALNEGAVDGSRFVVESGRRSSR